MLAFALIFPAVVITIVAVIAVLMPRFVSATVPLGVRIPADRTDDPVVRRAVRRYQLLSGIGWLVAILLGLVLVTARPALAVVVTLVAFLVLQFLAYVTSRTAIQHAKRAQGWYAGKPVRLAAELTPAHVPPPTGWVIAATAVILIACAVGIAVYPGLPQQIVTHWSISGTPNGWKTKSVWTVFAPLFVAAGLVALMFGLSFAVRRAPLRPDPAATAEQSAARAHALRTQASAFLGRIAFLISIEFAWISLTGWLLPDPGAVMRTGVIVIAALILTTIVLFFMRYRAALRTVGPVATGGGTDAPDDDRFWKAGVLYVNRDDPSILVQKRYGIGWTLNFGHPIAVVIGVVLLAVIVGGFGWRIIEASHLTLHW